MPSRSCFAKIMNRNCDPPGAKDQSSGWNVCNGSEADAMPGLALPDCVFQQRLSGPGRCAQCMTHFVTGDSQFAVGGAGGIRTLDTVLPYTHFPGERLRPLGHRSAFAGRAWMAALLGVGGLAHN